MYANKVNHDFPPFQIFQMAEIAVSISVFASRKLRVCFLLTSIAHLAIDLQLVKPDSAIILAHFLHTQNCGIASGFCCAIAGNCWCLAERL